MAFQTTIRADIGAGIVGDLAFEGPLVAQPGILNSADPADNVIGRAFTYADEGIFAAGAGGGFAGILANHAVYASGGTSVGGSLASTTTLRNGEVGEFVQETCGIFVELNTPFAIGNYVTCENTTGVLGAVATGNAVPVGYSIIPGAFVVRYNGAAPGLAVISLGTNTRAHVGA